MDEHEEDEDWRNQGEIKAVSVEVEGREEHAVEKMCCEETQLPSTKEQHVLNSRCTTQAPSINNTVARSVIGEDHSPHDSGFAQSNSDNSLSDSGGGGTRVAEDPPSTSEPTDNNWRLQVSLFMKDDLSFIS